MERKAVDLLSEPEVWILDETAFPKAGQHSVGVARQYCGTLGKVANCQVAVSLHWSSAEARGSILWRLYLPKEWLDDAERAAEVKLPPGTSYRSKTELALKVIDQSLAWELSPLPVVAEWLLVEWPQESEQLTQYWLAHWGGQSVGLRHFVRIARARW